MNDATTPTIAQALGAAARLGLARVDAHALMGALLDRERAWLIAHDEQRLTPAQAQQWASWLRRRLDGEPVAYVVGHHEFHGLRLAVGPAVLDPRPDTETLVDWALEQLATLPPGAEVADLGTGSGAVALAIRHRRPDVRMTAVELSAAALEVARGNGARLGLPVHWCHGRWFEPLAGRHFDLIVSNPPYIAADDPHLAALRHEPAMALSAGADGLDDIRELVRDAPGHLRRGAWLLLEHGHDQADAVAALMRAAGAGEVAHRQDLAGHRRCTGGRWA